MAIVRDAALFEERDFERRVEAIELLEFIGEAMAADSLEMARVAGSIATLEEVDERLFARLRMEIAAGRHRGKDFEALLRVYFAEGLPQAEDEPGYDVLDIFVNRLCTFLPMPEPIHSLEKEMVDYHKTPATVVLEVARRVRPEDVFVDLGAGLGQVALLVHLVSGARAIGLEIEPAYCDYSRECAAGLNLVDAVSFVEGDARFVDHSEGTIFFLYTPFTGAMLEMVFGLLRREALTRSFMVVTYGPCTMAAARQDWLRVVERSDRANGLCFFRVG